MDRWRNCCNADLPRHRLAGVRRAGVVAGPLAQVFDGHTLDGDLVDADRRDLDAGEALALFGVERFEELFAVDDLGLGFGGGVGQLVGRVVDRCRVVGAVVGLAGFVVLGGVGRFGGGGRQADLGLLGDVAVEQFEEVVLEVALGLRVLQSGAPQLVRHEEQDDHPCGNEGAPNRPENPCQSHGRQYGRDYPSGGRASVISVP